MDRRFGVVGDRLPRWVQALNGLSAVVFLGLGLKGYWELNEFKGLGILLGTLTVGWVVAAQAKILVCPFDRTTNSS